jgi:hypothetical protein
MSEKKFIKTDLSIMQNIVGKKLNNIFKQLDFFIINFGVEIEYSLHTYCFLRVKTSNEIILTSSDEYYLPNYKHMSQRAYKQDELHENSLLKITAEKTKEILKNAIVKKVKITNTADVIIVFDNGVINEMLPNFQQQKGEFFRFFKYHHHDLPHYVVKFSQGQIVLSRE